MGDSGPVQGIIFQAQPWPVHLMVEEFQTGWRRVGAGLESVPDTRVCVRDREIYHLGEQPRPTPTHPHTCPYAVVTQHAQPTCSAH